MKHVHLIGIGGTGLSAIARVLLESGYTVSGSDRQMSPLAQALQEAGVRVFIGHRAENIRGADLVVRSSAIPESNVEVQAALEARLPVFRRADFLGRLLEGRLGIGVAGTHGKTTTTAMLAWILTSLGQDPTFIIGGVSMNLGTNARSGGGPVFLIEADEYDRMFLGLSPQVAVVTNIEHDHLDCYPTPESFYGAFREFAGRVAPGGVLIGCGEDAGTRQLLMDAAGSGIRVRSYGIWDGEGLGDDRESVSTSLTRRVGSLAQSPQSPAPFDYTAQNLALNEAGGFRFEFLPFEGPDEKNGTTRLPEGGRLGVPRYSISLQVPGRHNVLNALAALGVIHWLGLPLNEAAEALGRFSGTGRRFQVVGEAQAVTVIDDYAHHPTEVRATLAAARKRYPERRIWAVWQPHTYSRTLGLLEGFAEAFGEVDRVVVTGIYAARESAPQGSTPGQVGAQVSAAIRHPAVHFSQELDEAAAYLLREIRAGDVVLVLSAGDADRVSRSVINVLVTLRLEDRRAAR
jgi:UDP-N-acetylmuramate--alanine ligase